VTGRRQDERRGDNRQCRDKPRDEIARARALEVAYGLEALLVIAAVVERGARARRGEQERQRGAIALRTLGRHDGEAVGLQREIDLRPATPILRWGPFVRGPPPSPIHDDRQVLVRAQRRFESREDGTTVEPIPRHDAQAYGLISHEDLLP
jgi:hypothetical protein